jgi:hypothetical protein
MNTLLRPKPARAPSTDRTRTALDTPYRKSPGRLRARLLLVSLLLPVLAAIVSPAVATCADVPQRKRVVVLRRSETQDGARFTLTSDSVLDDYRSYAEGERLIVLVPRAGLSSTRGELIHARGFADLRVEQREDGLLISFRLNMGASVSVNQNFNRLDVVFITNEQPGRSGPA